jgi:hypothetical protein
VSDHRYEPPTTRMGPVGPQAPGQGRAPVQKPGTITGAAVLGFIQAGITLIATVIFTLGLAQASALASGLGEMWAVDIAQIAGIVILIIGGVLLAGGKSRGLFLVATGLEIALSLYWAIRFGSVSTDGIGAFESFQNFFILLAIGFAIMPVIALILAAGSRPGQYIQAMRASR